jgi:hypothetical protein
MRASIRTVESVIIIISFLSFCCTIYLWDLYYFNEITGLNILYSFDRIMWLRIGGAVLLILAVCVRLIKSKKRDIIVYNGRRAMSAILLTISILNAISAFLLYYGVTH